MATPWHTISKGLGGLASGFTGNNSAKQAATKAWNRQMEASNTAYQRAVADMKAAGLNPMLAYSQGGASVPSAQPAETRALGGELVKTYTGWSGASSQRMVADATTQNLGATTAKTIADTRAVQVQTDLNELELEQKKKMNPQAAAQAELETNRKTQELEVQKKQLEALVLQVQTASTALQQQQAMNPLLRQAAELGNAAGKQNLEIGELKKEIAQLKLEALPSTEDVKSVKAAVLDAWKAAVDFAADIPNQYRYKKALADQKLEETIKRKAKK